MRKLHVPIGILLVAILLLGCFTPRKADKQLDKIQDNYPELLAAFCDTTYPVKTETKTDTLIEYDWLEIPCPDNEYIAGTDTVYRPQYPSIGKKTVTVKVRVPVYRYYITKTVESTAKLQVCKSEVEKAKSKRESLKVWFFILLGAFVFAVMIIVFKKI